MEKRRFHNNITFHTQEPLPIPPTEAEIIASVRDAMQRRSERGVDKQFVAAALDAERETEATGGTIEEFLNVFKSKLFSEVPEPAVQQSTSVQQSVLEDSAADGWDDEDWKNEDEKTDPLNESKRLSFDDARLSLQVYCKNHFLVSLTPLIGTARAAPRAPINPGAHTQRHAEQL